MAGAGLRRRSDGIDAKLSGNVVEDGERRRRHSTKVYIGDGGYNEIVRFLRYLTVIALAVWVGGLIVLGAVAAPSLFSTLTAHDPLQGRATAGAAFGAIFHRFQVVSWGLAGVVVIALGTRAALGPRPHRMAIRVWTVVVMLAISLAGEFVVARRIETLRRELPANLAEVADTDVRKTAFGRWHALSTALMGLTVIGGLGLLWAETHD